MNDAEQRQFVADMTAQLNIARNVLMTVHMRLATLCGIEAERCANCAAVAYDVLERLDERHLSDIAEANTTIEDDA